MGKEATRDGPTLCGYRRETAFLVDVSLFIRLLYWSWGATYDARIRLFGGPQLLPVWSVLESSPMYKDWDWSPLIHTTLEANGIPTPSDSHSARLRKSLPPTHPWAIKTAHKRSAALIEGPASNPNKARGAYPCTRRCRSLHSLCSNRLWAIRYTKTCRRACAKGRL